MECFDVSVRQRPPVNWPNRGTAMKAAHTQARSRIDLLLSVNPGPILPTAIPYRSLCVLFTYERLSPHH